MPDYYYTKKKKQERKGGIQSEENLCECHPGKALWWTNSATEKEASGCEKDFEADGNINVAEEIEMQTVFLYKKRVAVYLTKNH